MKNGLKIRILFLVFALCFAGALVSCARDAAKSHEAGRKAYLNREFEDAIKYYELAVSQGEEDPLIYAEMALCYQKLDREAKADECMTSAEILMAGDPRLEKYLGIYYLRKENTDEALSHFLRALPEESDDRDESRYETLGYIAEIRMKRGEYDEAIGIYNELIQNDYHATEHEILAGECYLYEHQFSAAEQYFQMLEKEESVRPSHYLYIVKACQSAEDYNGMVKYFDEGVRLIENSDNPEMTKGEYYVRSGRLNEARSILQNEDTVPGLIAKAYVYTMDGEYDEAENLYQNLILKGERLSEVYSGYMLLKIVAGDYAAAHQLFTKASTFKEKAILQTVYWNEIILYEMETDYETAYEKLIAYKERFGNSEVVTRELLFLQRVSQ